MYEAATLIRTISSSVPDHLYGDQFRDELKNFLFHLTLEGAVGLEELGFARFTDSSRESVDLIISSLPQPVRDSLKPPARARLKMLPSSTWGLARLRSSSLKAFPPRKYSWPLPP